MQEVKEKKKTKCFTFSEENIIKLDILRKDVQDELKEKYGITKKISASAMLEILIVKEISARELM